MHCQLHEGQVLFIPAGWFYEVESLVQGESKELVNVSLVSEFSIASVQKIWRTEKAEYDEINQLLDVFTRLQVTKH